MWTSAICSRESAVMEASAWIQKGHSGATVHLGCLLTTLDAGAWVSVWLPEFHKLLSYETRVISFFVLNLCYLNWIFLFADMREDICYAHLGPRGRCHNPIIGTFKKSVCCCSVGEGWGEECEACPQEGSDAYKDLCGRGHGFSPDPDDETGGTIMGMCGTIPNSLHVFPIQWFFIFFQISMNVSCLRISASMEGVAILWAAISAHAIQDMIWIELERTALVWLICIIKLNQPVFDLLRWGDWIISCPSCRYWRVFHFP